MQLVEGPPSGWTLPSITTVSELADWLGIEIFELDWFVDRYRWGDEQNDSRTCHYRRQWIRKPSGGLRILETPKPRLKQIQRSILHGILD